MACHARGVFSLNVVAYDVVVERVMIVNIGTPQPVGDSRFKSLHSRFNGVTFHAPEPACLGGSAEYYLYGLGRKNATAVSKTSRVYQKHFSEVEKKNEGLRQQQQRHESHSSCYQRQLQETSSYHIVTS